MENVGLKKKIEKRAGRDMIIMMSQIPCYGCEKQEMEEKNVSLFPEQTTKHFFSKTDISLSNFQAKTSINNSPTNP